MKNRSIPELECLETRQVPDHSGVAALGAFPLASAPLAGPVEAAGLPPPSEASPQEEQPAHPALVAARSAARTGPPLDAAAAPVLSQAASIVTPAAAQTFTDLPPTKSSSPDQGGPAAQDTSPALAGVRADVKPLEKSDSLAGGDSPKGGQSFPPIGGNASKSRPPENPALSRFDFLLSANRHDADEGAASLRQAGTLLPRRESGFSKSTLGTQGPHEPLKVAERARTASVGKLSPVLEGGPWLKVPGSRSVDDSAPAPDSTRPLLAAKAAGSAGELSQRGVGTPNGLGPSEVDKFFVSLWEVPREDQSPPPLMPAPEKKQPRTGGEGVYLAPVWLGVLVPATGEPLDPVARGYRYLCNYAHSAIHAAERRVGPLRDHEDIVQQVCVEWLERVGPPDEAFPRLLERRPEEMRLLRETVNRVIARAVYYQKKRDVTVNFTDGPAPEALAERDWADFKSDCERGVGNLTRQEWQVLELRRQGKTFAEIGSDTRLSKQRVCKIYHAVAARLQKIYASGDR